MIIRGQWRLLWKRLNKQRGKTAIIDIAIAYVQLFAVLPFSITYWLLFSIGEMFEKASDLFINIGYLIQKWTWG